MGKHLQNTSQTIVSEKILIIVYNNVNYVHNDATVTMVKAGLLKLSWEYFSVVFGI